MAHIQSIFPMTYYHPDYNKVSVSAHMIHGIMGSTFGSAVVFITVNCISLKGLRANPAGSKYNAPPT